MPDIKQMIDLYTIQHYFLRTCIAIITAVIIFGMGYAVFSWGVSIHNDIQQIINEEEDG